MSSSEYNNDEENVELSAQAGSLLAEYKAALSPDLRRRDRVFGRVCAQTEESTQSSDQPDEDADQASSGDASRGAG